MALPRIAINGFGRIGRTIMRIAKQRQHYDVVAINDLASPEQLAYAFKYDSIHGTFDGEVKVDGKNMEIAGDPFVVLNEKDPAQLPWAELGIDYVVESSGVFRKLEDLNKHLEAGAKRIILTVPSKDPLEATLVAGVNDHVVTPDSRIISNASCTTNCAAPLVKVLHEAFGIRRGLLTTVHAYTSDQRLIDSPHKDPRRSRNAATNIVPTSTGAARAIGPGHSGNGRQAGWHGHAGAGARRQSGGPHRRSRQVHRFGWHQRRRGCGISGRAKGHSCLL